MTFEIQLLIFALGLPLLVAIIGTTIVYQIQHKIPRCWLRWFVGLTLLTWLFAFLVSSSRVGLLEYVEADHYRKLPWFVLFAYLVGLLWASRAEFEPKGTPGKVLANDGLWWLGRCTLLCLAGWWLIPKGKGWEDTADWQPIWLLMAGLGGTWNWWSLTAVRQRVIACRDSKDNGQEETQIGWQLWIGVGALLGIAGLAGLSLASLAESLATVAAIAVGISIVGHFSASKLLTNLSESGVAAAISSGTVLAMAYPSSSVPKYAYIAMMMVPVLVSLVDGIVYRLGGKSVVRLLVCFVVTACVVGGLLGWVLLNEPADVGEDWE
jgi:hypothetical protein